MKFLIKIEEAVDNLILNFIEKMKHATPHSFYAALDWVKHSPQLVIKQIKIYLPKVRVFIFKFIGKLSNGSSFSHTIYSNNKNDI